MQGPSARIVAAANATFTIEDGEGKRITLRRLGVLDQLRLFKALGPMLAENRLYLGMARLAAAVTQIDDYPVPMMLTEAVIEDTIERLGDAGVAAIGRALQPASAPAGAEDAPGN